jgi:DNA repair exonuclease SbcCD nuclease subunit
METMEENIMEFAFIGDIHLSRYSTDKLEDEGVPERLNSLKNTLYFIANYCCDKLITKIVIGGDILHGKSIIHTVAQNLMLDYFDAFPLLTFIVMDGNHDLSGKGEAAVSSLRALKHVPNVVWITKDPKEYLDILFIPYTANVDNVVKSNKARILVSHFGLNEAVVNSGMSLRTNIRTSDLAGKYELVLLGHYHKPQEIITDTVKIYYSGSPIQLDWGEKNEEKRFLIVDTETLNVQSIPTEGYRKHVELEITNESKNDILKIADSIKKSGDHVKLIKRDNVDLKKFEKTFTIIDKTERDVTDRGITSSMSQKDKHLKYLNIKQIPQDQIEQFMKVGMNIIESCEGE